MRKKVLMVMIATLMLSGAACSHKTDGDQKLEESSSDTVSESNGWYTGEVTNSSTGYYMISDEQVMYYDFSSKQLVPLCNKAECTHTDASTCNSYIEDLKSGIHYINGKLYYIVLDNNGKLQLYKEDEDGSNRECVMSIMQCSSDYDSEIQFTISGDYLFYKMNEEVRTDVFVTKLYSKKLEDGSENNVAYYNSDEKIVNSMISSVTPKDGLVYFNDIYYYDDSSSGEIYGTLYSYNPETKELATLLDGVNYDWFIENNCVYYRNIGEGLKKLDLSTKEETTIVDKDEENPYVYMTYDGQYIYIDNDPSCSLGANSKGYEDRKIIVYDLSGNLIDTIDLSNSEWQCEFGDSHYLVLDSSKGYDLFDKSQLQSGKYDWESLDLGLNVESE